MDKTFGIYISINGKNGVHHSKYKEYRAISAFAALDMFRNDEENLFFLEMGFVSRIEIRGE